MLGLFTGAFAAAGIGLSIAGYSQSKDAAAQMAAYQQTIIAEQQKQEKIRMQAMELDSRRKTVEAVRQQQRARSLALAAAVNQGANQSSGLQSGYGQIQGQSAWNISGIQQQVQFGRQIFASNERLSKARMGYAGAQSDYMTGQGLSSLGGSLVSNASTLGNIFGGFKLV